MFDNMHEDVCCGFKEKKKELSSMEESIMDKEETCH